GNFLLQKSYQINKVIKYISQALGFSYANNNELVNHLASYIFQVMVRSKNSLFNITGIFPEQAYEERHVELIQLTATALKQYFPEIKFEKDDVLYIVFHLLPHLHQRDHLLNL